MRRSDYQNWIERRGTRYESDRTWAETLQHELQWHNTCFHDYSIPLQDHIKLSDSCHAIKSEVGPVPALDDLVWQYGKTKMADRPELLARIKKVLVEFLAVRDVTWTQDEVRELAEMARGIYEYRAE